MRWFRGNVCRQASRKRIPRERRGAVLKRRSEIKNKEYICICVYIYICKNLLGLDKRKQCFINTNLNLGISICVRVFFLISINVKILAIVRE